MLYEVITLLLNVLESGLDLLHRLGGMERAQGQREQDDTGDDREDDDGEAVGAKGERAEQQHEVDQWRLEAGLPNGTDWHD